MWKFTPYFCIFIPSHLSSFPLSLHPFHVYSICPCHLSVLSSFFWFILLVVLKFTYNTVLDWWYRAWPASCGINFPYPYLGTFWIVPQCDRNWWLFICGQANTSVRKFKTENYFPHLGALDWPKQLPWCYADTKHIKTLIHIKVSIF